MDRIWKMLPAIVIAATGVARANQTFISDNFSTYSSGNLVGQNGWVQTGTSATSPIQVTGGNVVLPAIAAGAAADNQDAVQSFGSVIAAPIAGTINVVLQASMNVSAAQANPAFILALNEKTDGTGFNDFRLTAKDNSTSVPNTYLFGARANGQAGYPFVFGTTPLTYNTTHNVVMQAQMIAGNQNDVVNVYIDPTSTDLTTQTPYLTETYSGTGSVTDPGGLASLVISQFASTTTGQDGVSISSATVTSDVPEPASVGLLAVGGALLTLRRKR